MAEEFSLDGGADERACSDALPHRLIPQEAEQGRWEGRVETDHAGHGRPLRRSKAGALPGLHWRRVSDLARRVGSGALTGGSLAEVTSLSCAIA